MAKTGATLRPRQRLALAQRPRGGTRARAFRSEAASNATTGAGHGRGDVSVSAMGPHTGRPGVVVVVLPPFLPCVYPCRLILVRRPNSGQRKSWCRDLMHEILYGGEKD